MPPYHGATIRVPERGIHEFFVRVSDAVRIPIMVQDAPVSGTTLSAPFLARMAREAETRSVTCHRSRWPGRKAPPSVGRSASNISVTAA